MNKSRLQELCHRKRCSLPEYSTTKDGPPHNPNFTATVTVGDLSFSSDHPARSAKEAQNNAAGLAIQHFIDPKPSPVSSSLSADADKKSIPATTVISQPEVQPTSQPHQAHEAFLVMRDDKKSGSFSADADKKSIPATIVISQPQIQPTSQPHQAHEAFLVMRDDKKSGSFSADADKKSIPATTVISQPQIQPISQSHQAHEAFLVMRDDKRSVPADSSSASNIVIDVPATKRTLQLEGEETCQTPEGMRRLYKTQLQKYTQKRNLPLPKYSCESTGPSHNPRFKSKVTIEGQTYESPEIFLTLKDAEHAAAKIALMSLSPAEDQEDDYGVYKNLLQEMARKEGYHLPVYSTEKSGASHMPMFLSTVEIEGETFVGQKSKTKKLAEMNAAKVAYTCLKERGSGQRPKTPSPHFPVVKAVKLPPSSSPSWGVADLSQNVRPQSNLILQSTIFAEQDEDREVQTDPATRSSKVLSSSSPQNSNPSPPTPSESCIDWVLPEGNEEDSAFKKVIVFPRISKISKPLPATAVLKPVGDDWVAAEFGLEVNE